MFSDVFCMYWGNINLAICFCGIAQINVSIVFYPATCFCGIARIHVAILFYTYWGNIKLAICFCAIARIHVFYCVLHVLGQYQSSDLLLRDRPNSCVFRVLEISAQCQTSDLLLRDCPNSCFLLCFTHVGAISD